MLAEQPSVFISFTKADRELAKRLHGDLSLCGARVFQFEESATVGSAAWSEVVQSVTSADWFVVLVTSSSVKSRPVLQEVEHAYHAHVSCGRPRIVPAMVHDVVKPPLLATFTELKFDTYESGLERLRMAMGLATQAVTGNIPAVDDEPAEIGPKRPAPGWVIVALLIIGLAAWRLWPAADGGVGTGRTSDPEEGTENGSTENGSTEKDGTEGEDTHTKITAYCVKCRSTREMVNPEIKSGENGKTFLVGTCAGCGTNMFKVQ